LAHVIEHVALELQRLAGMNTVFGRTRYTGEAGIFNIVFSYIEPGAGQYAAKAAVNITKAIINDEAYNLKRTLRNCRKFGISNAWGPVQGHW
jgi:cyanophycin synthetase